MTDDEKYMWRCLQLARCGQYGTRPNPMVGAVIVAEGRIIGEGYHRHCGEGHAEVNAFASVKHEDEPLIASSTLYVSLEPCAHWGKTPPCADLIVKKGIRCCVVGCVDSFAKVSGRGIQRIREAGIEVRVGVLEEECRRLNRLFFTYHSLHRPYITLKWAQTANGYIDNNGRAMAISSPLTMTLSHRLRSEADAMLVGRITDEREQPQLSNRLWAGSSPKKYVLSTANCSNGDAISQLIDSLYADGVQHLVVEGGRQTLQSFIDRHLFDAIRVETSTETVACGTTSPTLPKDILKVSTHTYGRNSITYYEPLS